MKPLGRFGWLLCSTVPAASSSFGGVVCHRRPIAVAHPGPSKISALTSIPSTVTVEGIFSAWLSAATLFSLEESEFCNKDYLEIRERNAHGKLLGRFCGEDTPMNITLANGLWLKFHSDDTDVAAGFSAHFATMRTVDLEGTSGVIESPLYPHDALSLGTFTWRLHVPDDLYPRISWDTIFFTEECWTSSLVLIDGIDEGSPEAAKYCSSRKPDPMVLRSSHVQLRFESAGGYAKWKMRWEAVNSSYLPSMEQGNAGSVCNFKIELDNATSVTNITSPGFPESYTDYLNCSWSLVAPSRRVSKISFNVVDLRSWELVDNCFYDYINVYDVDPTAAAEQRNLRSICGQIAKSDLPAPLLSSTRFMLLRFRSTDASRSEVVGKGFSASFQSVCGGNITEPSGVIQESDILDSEMQCRWRISSDRRVPLKITIENINLPSDGGACRNTFIQVLNGGQSDSPPLGQGKFCGSSSRVQELPKTSSATAFIIYRRNSPQKGQFRLRWEESGIECGGPIRLSREVKTRELTSPGYPHGAPAHAVSCDWTVMGPSRSRIRVDFPDSFHMRHGCHDEPDERRKDYVEVFDGGTANAPSLGFYCGSDRGDSLVSSGNLIALRYVQTNAAGDFLGFRSTVTLADCGGTLWPFNERSRNLEELREKLAEGSYFDCAWQLRSLDQTVVALSVRGLTLADSPGCTGLDFLEVRDGNRTGPVLAQICGPNSTLDVQSSENSMFLRVKLSSGTRHNPRSLTLRWHSEFSHCGGEQTADEGTFTSPGFPRPLEERRHCYWTIAAPEGNRVSLSIDGNINDCTAVLQELTETSGTLEAPAEALTSGSHYGCEWTLALTPNQTLAVTVDSMNFTTTENANCRAEFVHVSRRLCKQGDREVVVPQSEPISIHYSKAHNKSSGGFRASYRVNDCGGRLSIRDNMEFITTPRFPNNYPPNTDCVWIIEPDVWGTQVKKLAEDHEITLVNKATPLACTGAGLVRNVMRTSPLGRMRERLNFSSFSLEDNCSLDWLDVKSGNSGLAPSVDQYCGQRSPSTLTSTAFMLVFHSDSVGSAKGFNISVSAVGLGERFRAYIWK
ncbi:hypothetical protein HPB51_025558 [Rhipicephalus microplus]|uniref:CUB domain-containing protein n=1 Tax=Rhipicephalus microplus TaxID=6941 RepID=A0A9J6DRS8_RHIMP|nr:hypothetical protein HPB51_025558 [Rhipicephalus microplus]